MWGVSFTDRREMHRLDGRAVCEIIWISDEDLRDAVPATAACAVLAEWLLMYRVSYNPDGDVEIPATLFADVYDIHVVAKRDQTITRGAQLGYDEICAAIQARNSARRERDARMLRAARYARYEELRAEFETDTEGEL